MANTVALPLRSKAPPQQRTACEFSLLRPPSAGASRPVEQALLQRWHRPHHQPVCRLLEPLLQVPGLNHVSGGSHGWQDAASGPQHPRTIVLRGATNVFQHHGMMNRKPGSSQLSGRRAAMNRCPCHQERGPVARCLLHEARGLRDQRGRPSWLLFDERNIGRIVHQSGGFRPWRYCGRRRTRWWLQWLNRCGP
mgnify:CR=1 FL=1